MRSVVATVIVSSAMFMACAGEQAPVAAPPPPPPAQPPSDQMAQNNEKPGDNPNQSQINISDEIRKKCGISDTDAYFAFDSANIRPQDRKVLSALAKCFTDGPLAGRQMRLVGHADPRGEAEYNMLLGQRRADNVKTAIAGEGLKQDKMDTTSRGEMDASGTDETSYAKDRRVDIVLAD
ncbi:MAG TPA: OmpA family protein [Polyangiaceae bacterium]|nr:OmpA family protein [Polyangiaceae bacterium]